MSIRIEAHQRMMKASRHDSIRFDSIRFDSIRFDSIRFDSIRYDSRNVAPSRNMHQSVVLSLNTPSTRQRTEREQHFCLHPIALTVKFATSHNVFEVHFLIACYNPLNCLNKLRFSFLACSSFVLERKAIGFEATGGGSIQCKG